MDFSRALTFYLKYLQTELGYSELTVKEYQNDLRLFSRYLKEKKKLDPEDELDITEVNKFDLGDFLADLILERHNDPRTRNRRLFSLRSFFQFLVRQEIIKEDPSHAFRSSKTRTQMEPIYLRLPQASRFIETISRNNSKTAKRDQAIIKLFLYCGLRLSELVNLNVSDLDLKEEPNLRVIGKGNKERRLPLHEEVKSVMQDYLLWRQKVAGNNDNRSPLFLSLQKRRLHPRTIQMMVKKYAKMAGIENYEQITPHKLRHIFASLLYKETKDLRVLQELLGHSSVSTTQIYTHTDTEQRRRTIEKMPKF